MSRGQHLGDFEYLTLLAVLREHGSGYALSLRDDIETHTGRSASLGALYATLARLEEKGLVNSRLQRSVGAGSGKPRRVYRATPAGLTAARETHRAFMAMSRGLKWRPT